MRIALKISAAALALALAACASGGGGSAPVAAGGADSGRAQAAAEDGSGVEFGVYLSARFAASQHDVKDAARYYREALTNDPSNPELLALAFFYATSAGDIDAAAPLAAKVVAAQPDDRLGRLALAVAALKRHNWSDARRQMGLSAKGPFASITISLIDGWAAAGQGDKAGALSDLGTLRASGAADTLANFHIALLADFTGDEKLADTSYQLALQSGASPRGIDAYGRFLERNGRANDAKALYEKYAGEPGMKAVISAGLARIAGGRKPQALIVRAEDGAAEALFGMAAALSDQANTDVSVLYLRLALYLRPSLDLGAVMLADRLENLQKYEDAIDAYAMVDKSSPYYAMAAVEIALDEARLERTDAAIAHLKTLTAADPDDVDAWVALGDTYRSKDRFAEATDAYNHALALRTTGKPSDWPLYFARAVSEQGTKDWNAAEADLKKALELSPNEPTLLNYLGYTWVDQNRNIPQALAMLEKAHALKPTDGYIADSVGWAYYKLGRYADAAKALELAVQLVPGDPTINDHLGDAYWRVGRKLDAQFQWNHALAFGPSDADKPGIEKKLKDGLDVAGTRSN